MSRAAALCSRYNLAIGDSLSMSYVRQLAAFAVIGIALALPLASHAQGCALCRDTTAGSAPRIRQSLRRAILVLGLPAGAVFIGILVVAKRIKPRED
jgi:hypothetical protein